MTDPQLHRAPWAELTTTELYGILKLRTDVFFVEQKVDESELDWRDAEPGTTHYWFEADGEVVACLRVLTDAQPAHRDARLLIGRVVTHPDHRGRGLAVRLLEAAIGEFGREAMVLHAQSYVVPLYARVGFEAFGEEYEEAGIVHRSMYRPGGASLGGYRGALE
ncbi:GNAT family N-acetyltransferase [Herbiconiux moechotypicola]|uniref:GNAT family N-acetyltransferase n=1 Tax=Herbiconiux moechotypicola TaxID=637393 RepID=A0ABN3DTD7_9MICO|nr:GNAT family N-acetyltransferase [Herbiconiux moechotypicola]MCS5730697.1 GNAT family N-acetyltransferase [Herbiconiux moechotypicola]